MIFVLTCLSIAYVPAQTFSTMKTQQFELKQTCAVFD